MTIAFPILLFYFNIDHLVIITTFLYGRAPGLSSLGAWHTCTTKVDYSFQRDYEAIFRHPDSVVVPLFELSEQL